MKYKKTIASFFILLLIVCIYRAYSRKDFQYISLGDSLAVGENSYGESTYGYTDYVSSYLNKNHLLKEHIKSFSKDNYKMANLMEDIENNKSVKEKGRTHSLRRELRESDIVTLSIGRDDFLEKIKEKEINFKDITPYKLLISELSIDLDHAIKKLREYAKGEIILIGYYNPVPFLFNTSEKEMDELFSYIDQTYQKIAEKYQCTYLSTYEIFKKGKDFLPNPSSVNPNSKGYEAISKEIIDYLDKNVLN